MGCSKGNKPKDIPYYYTSHGIKPEAGNDWYCENGEWIWTVRGKEEKEIEITNQVMDALPYSQITREMYGSIKIDNKWKTVWTDSKYGDYVSIDGIHYELRTDWYKHREYRENGRKALKKVIPRRSQEDVLREKYGIFGKLKRDDGWIGDGATLKKPEWLKVPKLPKLSLPGAGKFMSTKVKLIVTLLGAFVLLILLLVALGYSGMGGAAGGVVEGEYKRKVK